MYISFAISPGQHVSNISLTPAHLGSLRSCFLVVFPNILSWSIVPTVLKSNCKRMMLGERKVSSGVLSGCYVATILDSRMGCFSFREARDGPRSGYLCLFTWAASWTALSLNVYQTEQLVRLPNINISRCSHLFPSSIFFSLHVRDQSSRSFLPNFHLGFVLLSILLGIFRGSIEAWLYQRLNLKQSSASWESDASFR